MKQWMIWSAGIAVGAVGGFLYWYNIGCVTGTCIITGSPVNSTLYGGLLGGLLVNSFGSKTSKENTESKHPDENMPIL